MSLLPSDSTFNYKMTDKITPLDSRVQSKFATLNGNKYHYLLAEPSTKPRATIFLVHGWPDCSFGWRFQIPLLVSLGLKVVVPDMMGYGLSSAPRELSNYTLKRASDDLAALAKEIDEPQIFILGHDWGGAVVWRFALWHPEMTKAVMSICTPFAEPSKAYFPLEKLVDSVLPNFRYQLQLGGPDVEATIVGKEKIRQFLGGMYGGRTPEGNVGFSTKDGILFDNLDSMGPSPLLSKDEADHYVERYANNGMRGPLNWYRTRKLNFDEELPLAEKGVRITAPSLFVLATKDAALPPKMSEGMDRHFDSLTRREVDAGHWALWQNPVECNQYLKEFLEEQLGLSTKL